MLKLHNTYSNTVEEFKPNSDNVKIYLCGPTVQSSPHIGHGRSAFSFILSYIVFSAMKATIGLRISKEAEKLGTDKAEIGVTAYAIRD